MIAYHGKQAGVGTGAAGAAEAAAEAAEFSVMRDKLLDLLRGSEVRTCATTGI
jgi:hypothetical protein